MIVELFKSVLGMTCIGCCIVGIIFIETMMIK